MLQSVGSQRVRHDLVTEQHRNSKWLEMTATNGWCSLARVQSRSGQECLRDNQGKQRRRS